MTSFLQDFETVQGFSGAQDRWAVATGSPSPQCKLQFARNSLKP
jgi:hypothetical protein